MIRYILLHVHYSYKAELKSQKLIVRIEIPYYIEAIPTIPLSAHIIHFRRIKIRLEKYSYSGN